MVTIGHFTFVLHSHLPWVLNHGVWPFGTSWLNEATAETYIPLLNTINELTEQGYNPALTIGMTPVLSEMLVHPKFKEGFYAFIDEKTQAARTDQDIFASENNENCARMARFWEQWYTMIGETFKNRLHEDVAGAFKQLQDTGVIEIITCAATHGYLPLLPNDFSVDAQVRMGVESYKRIYGRDPRGIWLPECAYRPAYTWKNPVDSKAKPVARKGVEFYLAKNKLDYFFVDTHLTMGGLSQGVYTARSKPLRKAITQFSANYKPVGASVKRYSTTPYLIHSPESIAPVAFFTRDERTGTLVWSGESGYPGDGNYLDFHKKHTPGGLRYWKVTGSKIDLGDKLEYVPEAVESRINENSSHYKDTIKGLLQSYYNETGTPGIVVAMYDGELFGHWWFEGPRFMVQVIKLIQDDPELQLTTASNYLDMFPPTNQISLPEGSWGQGGSHYVWLNSQTEWTWKFITECQDKIREIATKYSATQNPDLKRICQQLAREQLLLESSDWQFLISTWSARDYAEARVNLHHDNVVRLYKMAISHGSGIEVPQVDWAFLEKLESDDGCFPNIDIAYWA
ncbi:MAG TPA: 1,4-alpha-glucan branching protein domain-containing protein [Candidatus Lokiarchaeia archaeon]|nr:1,4-alpha-glucan branching protein domain-containing protein [Candidatus Lokiarchaeia archaeon]